MINEISDKQLKANRENSKKGGVKSLRGRAISSLNAVKHGILSSKVLPDDKDDFNKLLKDLTDELKPSSILKKIIVERIALHTLQLNKLSFARNEFLLACQNPGKIVDSSKNLFDFTVVEVEPYKPKINQETVDTLFSLFHRYEVSIENRLYRAINEYSRNNNGFVS